MVFTSQLGNSVKFVTSRISTCQTMVVNNALQCRTTKFFKNQQYMDYKIGTKEFHGHNEGI